MAAFLCRHLEIVNGDLLLLFFRRACVLFTPLELQSSPDDSQFAFATES